MESIANEIQPEGVGYVEKGNPGWRGRGVIKTLPSIEGDFLEKPIAHNQTILHSFSQVIKRLVSYHSSHHFKMPTLDQFKASMVLSAVGDALGYKNGEWEFCHSGEAIHRELKNLGGLEKIDIKGWVVSDDTVLHLATAEALVSTWKTRQELFLKIASKYKDSMVSIYIPFNLFLSFSVRVYCHQSCYYSDK